MAAPAPVEARRPAPRASRDVAGRPQPTPIFGAGDDGVVPPAIVERTLPPWAPADPALRRGTFSGVLEVLVDERGLVESVRLVAPISPSYDRALVEAAGHWRFNPATKDGRPVRFRKVLEIILRPTKE